MPKTHQDNCSLSQKERDDVVLAIISEGSVLSTTPPTDVEKMKIFILKNYDQVENLFEKYSSNNKISEIPNISEFMAEIVAPAVLSLAKDGKLPNKENIEVSSNSQLPKPQFLNRTPAHESYQSYAPTHIPKKVSTGQAK
jgi:hypothetical protein